MNNTQKNFLSKLTTLLASALFVFTLAGCADNDAEDAGEAIDEAVTDAGNAVEDACEDVKEGVDAKDEDC